ncbi:MAG TPA: hypothetical protein PLM91_04510 [Bacillota bacterium]|nr:hypothetical protein [Bacillota bacterium]HOB43343.1 hypothetical protein [Bacillota bacterium]HOK70562.1 hypothetical protein [Bacillota bacterium]HOL51446.1 hypothetical protein [Bacillota bacterium]HOO30334.1 hypothetical protein [Bacillota bacterium]
MNIVLLVLAVVVLGFYEAPDLIRNKLWRELAVFVFAVGLDFTLALLMLLGVNIPNPAIWIDKAAKWMLSLFR